MLGSATANFYNDAFARQGLGEQVAEVQRPWREGRRDEAARLVPRDIGQKTNLLGTPAMIADRIGCTAPPASAPSRSSSRARSAPGSTSWPG
jgi:hypothetical protein